MTTRKLVPVGERCNQRVVCAAIRCQGIVICGARHYDEFMLDQLKLCGFKPGVPGHWEQGFIDQRGNFLTRTEAWNIAKQEGQILRDTGRGDKHETLISEDLY